MTALTGQQQRRVREVLMVRFDRATLKRFVREALNRRLDDFANDDNFTNMSNDLLETAGRDNWIDELLTALAGEVTTQANLAAVINEIRQARGRSGPYVPQDHFETCFVGPRAFIDRTTLRSHLRDLAPAGGYRVLRISGPAGCGKSFSRYFIAYLAQEIGCFSAAVVDFREWSPLAPTPEAFMRAVAVAMALDDDVTIDRYSADAAQLLMLRSWLASQLADRPNKEWCLVIDSIDTVDASERSVQLAIDIAHAAERLELPNMRVVLIGHSGGLPAALAQFTLHEEVSARGAPELTLFFRSIAEHMGVDVEGTVLDYAVQTVMRDLPGDNMALFEMQSRARKTAAALFGPGPWR